MADTYARKAKGDALEAFVADHYTRLGYVVKRNAPLVGQQADMIATLILPDGQSHAVLIECKHHDRTTAGNDDVQSIAGAFNIAKTANLVQACTVVTTTSFSRDAQLAATAAGIHLLTKDQLAKLTHQVPLAYALPLRLAYERAMSAIPFFVHGHGHTRPQNTELPDLAEFLYERAATEQGFTLLFGSVGTGKTTQLLTVAARLANEYVAGASVPIGIYVPLERFTRHRQARYFDDFVIAYLRDQYRMRDVSWADVAEWLASRTAMLLLDGFDEIAHVDTETAIMEEFEHISSLIPINAATIVSCRTTLAARSEHHLPDLLNLQLAEHGHGASVVVESELFAPADVIAYMTAVGASKRLITASASNPVLRRPLLLTTLLAALSGGSLARIHVESAPALLEYCVTLLLQRRTALRQAGLSPSEWRTFLEECALRMMLDGTRQIDPQGLAVMIRNYFVAAPDLKHLRRLEFDASVRTVLDFDLDTTGLRWSHAVFRDFLAAGAIARRLIVPQPKDSELHGHLLTVEQVEFVQHAVRRRERDWKGVREFRRPPISPPALSPRNPWQWISPGLCLVNELPVSGGRLVYFPSGYWMNEQPLAVDDLRTIGATWIRGDQTRYRRLPPNAPLTHITHDEATSAAASVGARLPTEMEWERAARWIDGSYPRPEVIPTVDDRHPRPPFITGAPPNPWGLRNTIGFVWHWTATFDAPTQRFICRGLWWGADMEEKLNPTKRLAPREPDHLRTGVRFVLDMAEGTL